MARGIAAGALVVAVVVVAVLLLSGGSEHTYHVLFQNSGQLVTGDDVQVGGHRVGSVETISLTQDNQADIKISVAGGFAPLHVGTDATIRQTSLSGVANRYIALDPGPNSAAKIEDGSTIAADNTTTPVDLDQLFDTLDPPTRLALQQFIQGSAAQYEGKGKQANRAAQYFNPALSTTSRLVSEIVSDQKTFTDFVSTSSRVVTALAARGTDLTNLVSGANQTTQAIASENTSFDQALLLLPLTLRRANSTFVNLRATVGDLNTLVNVSKPADKHLAQFLSELRPLVHDARPTIAKLRVLLRKPGPGNDLVDLLQKTPRLEKVAKPAFASGVKALNQVEPDLEFIRPYTPDLVGWFRDFGQGASTYDANGHYARISPAFNAYNLNDQVLTPQAPSQRLAGLSTGNIERCPGTASQIPADGSTPFRDSNGTLDCDPTQVPEG